MMFLVYLKLLEDCGARTAIEVPDSNSFIVRTRHNLIWVGHHDRKYVIRVPLQLPDHE